MRDTWISEKNTGDQHRKRLLVQRKEGVTFNVKSSHLGGKTKVSASPKEGELAP